MLPHRYAAATRLRKWCSMSLRFLWRLWKNIPPCAMFCSSPTIMRFLKQCAAIFPNSVGIRSALPTKRAITTIRLPIPQPRPSANRCGFLAQIDAMAQADFFAGSIAVGPSLFLLEMLYPQGLPVDCRNEDLARAAQLSIPDRDQLARTFLKGI